MYIKILLTSLIFTLSSSFLYAQELNPGMFYDLGYDKLQEAAKANNKPFFVFFYRDGCMACNEMETKVFAHPNLQEYISNHYYAYRAKAFSIYSDYLVKKYEVNTYPQILIFTPQGKLVRRLRGTVSAIKLLAELKAQEKAKGKPEPLPEVFEEDADPAYSVQLQEEGIVKGLFKFSIRQQEVEEKTLGIQLGVFEDYNNIVRVVLELEKNWHDNILVSESELENEPIYRLILGPFYSIEHAESYQRNIREKYGMYGIIIHLDDLSPYSWEERSEYSLEQFEKSTPEQEKDLENKPNEGQ